MQDLSGAVRETVAGRVEKLQKKSVKLSEEGRVLSSETDTVLADTLDSLAALNGFENMVNGLGDIELWARTLEVALGSCAAELDYSLDNLAHLSPMGSSKQSYSPIAAAGSGGAARGGGTAGLQQGDSEPPVEDFVVEI